MAKYSFKDKVIVITGASSGIGKELAFRMAEAGASLALGARNMEKLETVAEVCRQKGSRAIAIPVDVSDKEDCRNFIEKTVDKYGEIDVLVNNAGITDRKSVV